MILYWWVPVLILTTVFYYYCSVWANDTRAIAPMFYMWLIQAFGLWPVVARYSKSLLFDGLLFDGILMVTCVAVLAAYGKTESFGLWQWSGVAMTIIGLLLVKTG